MTRLKKDKPKPLSAAAIQHIQGQLRRLEATGRVLRQGGRTFISCPFHNEKTPSCLVTTQVSKFEIGSYTCLGCGAHGKWNELATALNLAPVGDDMVAKVVQNYDAAFYDKLTSEKRFTSYKGLLADLEIKEPKRIPDDQVWRTLPGEFLNRVKACHVKGRDGNPYLFLPSYMNGDLVGGIRALMKNTTDKSIVKYKNSSGQWSRAKGLYPYDFAAEAIDEFEEEFGFRAVVLVEGARDSLSFNCEGIPTLGVLGTQSWCAGKLDSILDLDVDFVLVCMDGDKSGREAEDKIWQAVKKLVPCRKMNLSRFNKEYKKDIDPGNAPPAVVAEVWKALHRRKAQWA